MPSSEQILSGLRSAANNLQMLAVLWHVYLAAAGLLLLFGVRPSMALAGVLLAVPLASVSAVAWSVGNPFNGTVFAVVAVVLAIIALRLGQGPVTIGPTWSLLIGVMLLAFGWVYPHFLETRSFVPYLYSAPVGLIPCPTLSAVIGLVLILGGLGSRVFSIVLGAVGVLYGVVGVFRLGVVIDVAMLAGAVLLLVTGIARRAPGPA